MAFVRDHLSLRFCPSAADGNRAARGSPMLAKADLASRSTKINVPVAPLIRHQKHSPQRRLRVVPRGGGYNVHAIKKGDGRSGDEELFLFGVFTVVEPVGFAAVIFYSV